MRQDFIGINEAAASIRLRLNPSEKLSRDVLNKIEEIERLLAPGSVVDYRDLNAREKELVMQASSLLKAEWMRVKGGERTYRVAKWVALLSLFAFVTALIAFWFGELKQP